MERFCAVIPAVVISKTIAIQAIVLMAIRGGDVNCRSPIDVVIREGMTLKCVE